MSVSCSICLKDIKFCDEEISVLKCGHLFHQRCLRQWLNTSSTCPECRCKVITKNVVQKLYPSVNRDADLVYRGSSNETKSIFKIYEDSTKNLQKMFNERIVNLEEENSTLTEKLQKSLSDVQKCSDEKDLVETRNIKLTKDLQKSLDEKDVVVQENLRLKSKIKQFKNDDKEIKDLKEQNKKLKKKLSSVMKLIKDEDSSDEESTSLKDSSQKAISNDVPSTS